MKKTLVLILSLLVSASLTACGSSTATTETKQEHAGSSNTQPAQPQTQSKPKKVLVAYYSWGGNTREVARQIQKSTGGDLFEIQPVTPYPSDYEATTKQAKEEIASEFKPALKAKVDNLNSYDVVFVGSPVWWGTVASPVTSFLTENNLTRKTVVPFVTHAGSGQARCFDDIAKLSPQSTILKGFVISGRNAQNGQAEVDKWLSEINMKN